MCRTRIWLVLFALAVQWPAAGVEAQLSDRRFGTQRGAQLTFEPRGPGALFDALDPALKKWYVPQELFNDYGFRQWDYSNYAREQYQRYVDTNRQGGPFYDLYGNYQTWGWLIFDWNQTQPGQFGSSIYKDRRFNSWFNAVTVSSDSRGQYYLAITVGERIRTALTPMTFSKPRFNGVQMDFSSDKYEATMLFSRASDAILGTTPERQPSTTTNATNLMGGRATAQVGDFVKLGATLVNAHNSQTLANAFERNPFVGTLGAEQGSNPVTAIAVVLSDDSPEDGIGGAALFAHDIVITSEDFETRKRTKFRLRELVADPTKWPVITGGFPQEGFLAADGEEKIVINYDFTDLNYIGPRPTEIVDIEFDLVVANDYKIQVWSDRQVGRGSLPNPPLTGADLDQSGAVLFNVRSAEGNVTDNSNQRRIVFDYGLPSANMVFGFTMEVANLWGFDAYSEFDINRAYTQYPNLTLTDAARGLVTHAEDAEAWMVNVTKEAYPYYFFGEAFSMDPDYSTTSFIVDSGGNIFYDDERASLYEFVDDNDDQDRTPDWSRRGQGGPDAIVFPGWDENNDFVSDFNQNDNISLSNRIPDYEEPFFRYSVDRPEFLFGIDLNNNDWIDRFENDDLPDYPYRRNHQGYNVYLGQYLRPDMRITVGRLREEEISSDRRNYATYGVFTFDRDHSRWGRLRLFNSLKKVKDNIPDDRRQMTPDLQTLSLANVEDILPARDTWVSSNYLQFDYQPLEGFNAINKFKYSFYNQQGQAYKSGSAPTLNSSTRFFGLINKADYTYQFGSLVVQPKIKSEYIDQSAFLAGADDRKEWMGIGILQTRLPVLNDSFIESGLEYSIFRELELDEDELLRDGPAQDTGDFRNLVLALQWTTSGYYLGYRITTQFGYSYNRRWDEAVVLGDDRLIKKSESRSFGTSFISVYAGVE
ncbi:MAG: hypothetical protein GKR89_11805 [Candidatus Latescibacteria bacterium]|nr:hypothetical protein [Candidatus Latescibacterota bacterium]